MKRSTFVHSLSSGYARRRRSRFPFDPSFLLFASGGVEPQKELLTHMPHSLTVLSALPCTRYLFPRSTSTRENRCTPVPLPSRARVWGGSPFWKKHTQWGFSFSQCNLPMHFCLSPFFCSRVFFSSPSVALRSSSTAAIASEKTQGSVEAKGTERTAPSVAGTPSRLSLPAHPDCPVSHFAIPSSFPPLTLPSRALFRLTGEEEEVLGFLQGLVTCDMRRLASSSETAVRPSSTQSIWGCFLELKGRVLADAYFYKESTPTATSSSTTAPFITLWLEVEKGTHATLLWEHLLEMRMRRKIGIEDVSERFSVVAELKWETTLTERITTTRTTKEEIEGLQGGMETRGDPVTNDTPMVSLSEREEGVNSEKRQHIKGVEDSEPSSLVAGHAVCSFEDSRSPYLFASSHQKHSSTSTDGTSTAASSSSYGRLVLRKHFIPQVWSPSPDPFSECSPYTLLLAAYGVGEGSAVFPSHKALPFDGNADLLAEGIAFDKGCYIGQELTHRTHVMLVVRKRLLPIVWWETPETSIQEENVKKAVPPLSPSAPHTATTLRIRSSGQPLQAGKAPSGKVVGAPLQPALLSPLVWHGVDHRPLPHIRYSEAEPGNTHAIPVKEEMQGCRANTTSRTEEKGVQEEEKQDHGEEGKRYGLALVRMQFVDPATHGTLNMRFHDGTPVYGVIPEWWSRKEVKKMFRKLKQKE